jgi:hypothetical protein
MLVLTPVLSFKTYLEETDSFGLGLKFLSHMDPYSNSFQVTFKEFVEQ